MSVTYGIAYLATLAEGSVASHPPLGPVDLRFGSLANAIRDDGVIVGGSRDIDGFFRACFWDCRPPVGAGGKPSPQRIAYPVALHDYTWPWTGSVAYALNQGNMIVGGTDLLVNRPVGHAFVATFADAVQSGVEVPPMSDLLGPGALVLDPGSGQYYPWSWENAIARSANDDTIVGQAGYLVPPAAGSGPVPPAAVRWTRTGSNPWTAKHLPGGLTAAAINSSGAIVGLASNGGFQVGCLWDPSLAAHILLPPGGAATKGSYAWAIAGDTPRTVVGSYGDNAGQGALGRAGQDQHACLWETADTSVTLLAHDLFQPAKSQSIASAVNDDGLVVGGYYDGLGNPSAPTSAYVYDSKSGCQNLNDLLDQQDLDVLTKQLQGTTGVAAWKLMEARGINKAGQIIAVGQPLDNARPHRSFLLTPK